MLATRAAKYNVIAKASAIILWDGMIGETNSDLLRYYGTRRSNNPRPVLVDPFAVIASAISCILHSNGIPYTGNSTSGYVKGEGFDSRPAVWSDDSATFLLRTQFISFFL